MIFGIIGAMDEEVEKIKNEMIIEKKETNAKTIFYKGVFEGKNIILVRCGIGKVNAAIISQILITQYKVDIIINTGVAGGIKGEVDIGDVVISTDVIEHDFDASKFGYELGQIPRLDVLEFKADEKLVDLAFNASKKELSNNNVFKGRIVSGDIFVAEKEQKEKLWQNFKAYCVEMEGAAIGHSAYINDKPFLIIRAISDKADGKASENYDEFVNLAIENSINILKGILKSCKE